MDGLEPGLEFCFEQAVESTRASAMNGTRVLNAGADIGLTTLYGERAGVAKGMLWGALECA